MIPRQLSGLAARLCIFLGVADIAYLNTVLVPAYFEAQTRIVELPPTPEATPSAPAEPTPVRRPGSAAGELPPASLQEPKLPYGTRVKVAVPGRDLSATKVLATYVVFFRFNSFQVGQTAQRKLREIAHLYKTAEAHVVVQGHSDASGPSAYNRKLSERRTRSVASLLKRYGVRERDLTLEWYGEEQLQSGRPGRANRRVEVRLEAK